MSQIVTEQLQSRSLSVSGGRVTGTRVFVVYDDASAITQPATITLGANGMPQQGDLFPGETSVYAISHTIDPLGDGAYTWRVTWQYGPNTVSPNELGYVERSISQEAVFYELFRINVPSSYSGNGSNGADIGGTPIDSGGYPVSRPALVINLDLVENVAEITIPARLVTIAGMVGKRNSVIFEGFAAGTLVYTGATSSRIGTGLFGLAHRFQYRVDGHMIQQPKRTSQGDVGLQFYPQYGFVAKDVYFVQPFPQLADFDTLSENF